MSASGDGLGPEAALAVIVNACMGMGFLSMPITSLRLGPLVAIAVIISLGGMALLTALWTAIALSLAAALGRPGGDAEVCAQVPVLARAAEAAAGCRDGDPFGLEGATVLSYVEMVGAMYGIWARRVATAMLSLGLAVAMWAYAALVASSLAAMVPVPLVGGACDIYDTEDNSCRRVYTVYILAFALLEVALSARSFREQRCFQLLMTGARLLLVLSIVGDCARMRALGEAPPRPGSGDSAAVPIGSAGQAYDSTQFPSVPSPARMDPRGLPAHVAVTMAALTVHMVIPDAVQDLVDKPRNLLPTVGSALGFCIVVYCLVSAAVVFTFGDWTRPVCTLNWAHYTAGQPAAGPAAIAFRSWILLVPIVDVTAAYPVLATSLASTLRACTQTEGATWQLRVACAVCPILGAALVFDLPKILGWAGVLMLPFVFVLPPMLLLRAEHLCVKHFGADRLYKSTYWRWHCDRRITTAVLSVGVFVTLAASPTVLGFESILF